MSNTANTIRNILSNVSVTFANIEYTTPVATAAKHRAVQIEKHTVANVQLFSNIKAATSVFANAVKKTAGAIESNTEEAIAKFRAQENYFFHTDCYSIVQHKSNNKQYLYCIYNNAKSEFTIDGKPATRTEVAQFLTPSAASKLLTPSATTHNKTYNVEHSVTVRTIALDNITSITCNKQQAKL